MSASTAYLQEHQTKKTILKVFLVGGAMLSGRITAFGDSDIVLDQCLINRDQIISIALSSAR